MKQNKQIIVGYEPTNNNPILTTEKYKHIKIKPILDKIMKQNKQEQWEIEFDKKFLILKDFDGGDVSNEEIIRHNLAVEIKQYVLKSLSLRKEL